MRVVVVDPDVQFSALIAERLADEGHDVACADNPQKLGALLRARSADAVIVDLSLRRMNGFDVARSLREESGDRLRVILVSPSHEDGDSEVEALMNEVRAQAFFARPMDLDLMAEELAKPLVTASPKPAPVAPTRAPEPGPREAPSLKAPRRSQERRTVAWETARQLMQHWADRDTGSLEISNGDRKGTVSIRDGGLVDPTAVPLVDLALGGGVVEFRAEDVDGPGDWTLLGNQVFVMCRSACDDNTVLGYMKATPVSVERTEMARALSITGPTRRLMGAIDGESDLGTLMSRCQATPSEVSSDIEALVQLGLLELRRGVPAPSRATGATDVEVSDGEAEALQNARSSSDLEGLPSIDQSKIAFAHRAETPEMVETRLKRELETIGSAPPPVVLGVPAEASTSLVDEAAARMRDRYSRLTQDLELPSETRKLAKQIGQIIDGAHRQFQFEDQPEEIPEAEPQLEPVDLLLEQGRDLIAQGQWAEADSILTQAHRHQLDHPGVLSNLGWARLHNPGKPEESRTEEARDFLLLSEQFDPHHADGQYFLAQFLFASNLIEAAAERAQRAKAASSGEPARAALYRKIQIALAASQP